MPKEIITNGPYDPGENWVEVGWQKGLRSVQLVSRSEDDEGGTGAWYADLDRETVNKLIRVLRRARDQAYGADA